jgi:hypothetical protein
MAHIEDNPRPHTAAQLIAGFSIQTVALFVRCCDHRRATSC